MQRGQGRGGSLMDDDRHHKRGQMHPHAPTRESWGDGDGRLVGPMRGDTGRQTLGFCRLVARQSVYMGGKHLNIDAKMLYTTLIIKDGKKIAQVDERISQIVWRNGEFTIVKFNDDATRHHMLENGVIQFDRKHVIVPPWTTDLDGVDYEWLPIKCKSCNGFGHGAIDSRKVIVLAKSSQYVHCYVKMVSHNEADCVTFVYGSNSLVERKILWDDLTKLKFPIKLWIILGDFNVIFHYEDRIGENLVSKNELEDVNNWINLGLVDLLNKSGSHYTWTNNQVGIDRIYSRIDHAFKNEA
uniref:Uncharacterized protein n=1 Tax=Cannabis sativa TaxID=3483 RepID=A0A803NL63_CANSA